MKRLVKTGSKVVDEASVMAVFLYLASHQYGSIESVPDYDLIIESIKRSTTELGDDADLDEVANYVQSYDVDQIGGLLNNIKGIYHEVKVVDMENSDGDDIQAQLFEETNHPGTDVRFINLETGIAEDISLKATDSKHYIRLAQENYPDVKQYVTTEVDDIPGTYSTGLSNHDLTENTHEVIDDLHDPTHPADFIPYVTLWTTAIAITPVFMSYKDGHIDKEQCISRIANITGWKLVKVMSFLALLSFPLTSGPTVVYLIGRMLYSFYKTYT